MTISLRARREEANGAIVIQIADRGRIAARVREQSGNFGWKDSRKISPGGRSDNRSLVAAAGLDRRRVTPGKTARDVVGGSAVLFTVR